MQTGTEHPNATLVREGMEASTAATSTPTPTLSDDIVWHQIGAPTLHGKQEMAEIDAGRRHGLEHHDRDP